MKLWMILATSVVVLWAPGLDRPTSLLAQNPAATDPASVEAEVHRKYLRLETLMGRLLAALKDPGTKKGVLNRALVRSRELRIADRLESVKRLLEKKAFRDALGEEEILDRDIERVLAILRGEDALEGLRRRDQELDKAQEELERMIRLVEEEQKILEETAKEADGAQKDSAGSAKRKELADRQRELQKKADELRRALDRKLGRDSQPRGGAKSAAKDQESQKDESAGKDEQGKDENGDQKDQTDQDPGAKDGNQKAGGKKSGSKSGQKSGGKKSGGQKSGQKQAGEKQGEKSDAGKESDEEGEEQLERMARSATEEARQAMRKAAQRMSGAAQRLDSENMEGAEEDQREALEHLQQAQEALEEEQASKEEERQRALAAALTGQLQAMLSEAKLVRAETEALHQKTPPPPSVPPANAPATGEPKTEAEKTPAESPKPPHPPAESLPERTRRAEARDLGRRERALVSDADEVLKILEEDGSSDVAPPIITRVKEDLENAGGLLDRGETGGLTQAVQTEVEWTLAELIDALAPARRGGRRGGPRDPSSVGEMAPPGAGQTAGAQRKQKLINPVQEIRMLASSQRRVRGRTEKIEGLPNSEREVQAAQAAAAEMSLESLAQKVIERNPLIDPFILGEGGGPDKDEGDEAGPKPEGDPRKDGSGDATKN